VKLINVIRTRRAVREYTDARVDRTTMERLIGAAILAPSAMNLQPWAFAVLLDGERISGYAHRAKDWLLANVSQFQSLPAGSLTISNLCCSTTPQRW
jgi:nitroreductase